jgi:hypothetical protein
MFRDGDRRRIVETLQLAITQDCNDSMLSELMADLEEFDLKVSGTYSSTISDLLEELGDLGSLISEDLSRSGILEEEVAGELRIRYGSAGGSSAGVRSRREEIIQIIRKTLDPRELLYNYQMGSGRIIGGV